jgi:hypothetical protein
MHNIDNHVVLLVSSIWYSGQPLFGQKRPTLSPLGQAKSKNEIQDICNNINHIHLRFAIIWYPHM